MRDILTRAQIELTRETRSVNFLCDACNRLTAQSIDALPAPSNPDIEPEEKWHYATHVSLLKAKCDDRDCISRVTILAPTGRGMEPNPVELLPLYYHLWTTLNAVLCANGHPLALPPVISEDVPVKVIFRESKTKYYGVVCVGKFIPLWYQPMGVTLITPKVKLEGVALIRQCPGCRQDHKFRPEELIAKDCENQVIYDFEELPPD